MRQRPEGWTPWPKHGQNSQNAAKTRPEHMARTICPRHQNTTIWPEHGQNVPWFGQQMAKTQPKHRCPPLWWGRTIMDLVSLKNTLKLKFESDEMQFVCAFSNMPENFLKPAAPQKKGRNPEEEREVWGAPFADFCSISVLAQNTPSQRKPSKEVEPLQELPTHKVPAPCCLPHCICCTAPVWGPDLVWEGLRLRRRS